MFASIVILFYGIHNGGLGSLSKRNQLNLSLTSEGVIIWKFELREPRKACSLAQRLIIEFSFPNVFILQDLCILSSGFETGRI